MNDKEEKYGVNNNSSWFKGIFKDILVNWMDVCSKRMEKSFRWFLFESTKCNELMTQNRTETY